MTTTSFEKKIMRSLMISIVFVAALCLAMIFQHAEVHASGYSSAPTLQFEDQWTGNQYIYTDNDTWYGEKWYKIVAPQDGEYEMRIMTYSADGVDWELKSTDLSIQYFNGYVNYGTESSPQTKVWNMSLKQGTYYLKLFVSSDIATKFKMKNTFTSYGTNDSSAVSFDSPQSYSIGTLITGMAGPTDSEDWFSFYVPKKCRLILNIKTYHEEGVDWKLYNHDLSDPIDWGYVDYGTLKAPKTKKMEIEIPAAGKYNFKISNEALWGAKYIFSLEWLTQNNCIHEYDYKTIGSTYFAKGYTLHKCYKCGKTYKSDYRAVLKLETPYIYMISPRKKKARVIWYGQDSNSSGYQIRYSRSKKMSKSKTQTIKGKNKECKEIKKLASKKKYYFQVRAFKKSGNKTAYSSWSGKRSTKVK